MPTVLFDLVPALLIPALSYAAAWSVFRLLYLARWHRELRAAGLR